MTEEQQQMLATKIELAVREGLKGDYLDAISEGEAGMGVYCEKRMATVAKDRSMFTAADLRFEIARAFAAGSNHGYRECAEVAGIKLPPASAFTS